LSYAAACMPSLRWSERCTLVSCTIYPHLSTSSLSTSADHSDLHSFPTRRSSDLVRCRSPPGASHACVAGRCITAGRYLPRRRPRSEEHTSELQSHLNLVCRLLLEKKKRKSTRESHRCSSLACSALCYYSRCDCRS